MERQVGIAVQNTSVTSNNMKVSKKPCISHMCDDTSHKADQNIQDSCVKVNEFIHITCFHPHSCIDSSIVSNCHSDKVNAVIEDTVGRVACKSVCAFKKGGKNPVKGKNE